MAAAVIQPQPDGRLFIVDEIVLPQSNTIEAVEKIEDKYWRWKEKVSIYPDASGGAGQTAVGKSDLDIFKELGYLSLKYKPKNPLVSDRVNAVNRQLMSADQKIHMLVDSSCKHTIRAFEQVIYEPGTRKVDKSDGIEHIADAIGYCINYERPTRKFKASGISL